MPYGTPQADSNKTYTITITSTTQPDFILTAKFENNPSAYGLADSTADGLVQDFIDLIDGSSDFALYGDSNKSWRVDSQITPTP